MQMENTLIRSVIPIKAPEVLLYTGEEVFDLLSKETFQKQWDSLYNDCSWATVCQSRAFVQSWYQTYRNKYLAIVVVGIENGKLSGLLTLALPKSEVSINQKKGRIIGAGQFVAEYQTWIATEGYSNDYIKMALLKLMAFFPKCDIHIKYIPPQVSLSWINDDKYWYRRCIVQSYKRPLMEMNDSKLSKIFKKDDFKVKLNRLKRLGDFQFERITNYDSFASIIGELAVQFDFRQGAMFNKNQFSDDPVKIDFFLEMFKWKLLHVTVMKINGKIIASIVAVAGKGWVHLCGINTHAPFGARNCSPGYVHFIKLGQLLAEEGAAVFDLTPGNDFYKDRLATRYDKVHELFVSNNFSSRLKKHLRIRMYKQMLKAGKWPMGMEVSIKRRIYIFKERLRFIKKSIGVEAIRNFGERMVVQKKQRSYMTTIHPSSATTNISIGKNTLKDLLAFNGFCIGISRWEFLQDAMYRLEQGHTAYTWNAEEGHLLACVWLINSTNRAGGELQFTGNDNKVVLEELNYHPAAAGRLAEFVSAIYNSVAKDLSGLPLFVTSKDRLCWEVLESLGFEPVI
jgi:CelD/BcsL family acetyltransferase involved in cellulose biosynthesis